MCYGIVVLPAAYCRSVSMKVTLNCGLRDAVLVTRCFLEVARSHLKTLPQILHGSLGAIAFLSRKTSRLLEVEVKALARLQ